MAEVNFDNVSMLLHMDGADAGTVFTDSSDNGFTITPSGNAQTSVDQFKFAPTSGKFDGNDFIVAPNDTVFDFGDGDFTIAYWMYPTSVTGFQNMVSKRTGFNFAPFNCALNGDKPRFRLAKDLLTFIVDITSTIAAPINTLTYVAMTRHGGDVDIWVGGASGAQFTGLTGSVLVNTAGVYIGAQSDAAGGYTGFIDEVLVVKGEALYTEAFTPPTTPWVAAPPPSVGPVVTGPLDDVATQGGQLSFELTDIVGDGPFAIQWHGVEEGYLLAENGTILLRDATLARDQFQWFAVVTDINLNETVSDIATGTVNPLSVLPPVLTGPADVTVKAGELVTLYVGVSGAGPFDHVWQIRTQGVQHDEKTNSISFVARLEHNGLQFRDTVTDVSGLVTSSRYATVKVEGKIVKGTADVDYPCKLPGALNAVNAYQSSERVRRNALASGPPLYILEDDDGFELFDVAWSFDALQTQSFRSWFRCETDSGSKRFNIELTVDGFDGIKITRTHECYFEGTPQYKQVGRRWRVTAQLLAIDEAGQLINVPGNLPTSPTGGILDLFPATVDPVTVGGDIGQAPFIAVEADQPENVNVEFGYSCSAHDNAMLRIHDLDLDPSPKYWRLNQLESSFLGPMTEFGGSTELNATGTILHFGQALSALDVCVGVVGWVVRAAAGSFTAELEGGDGSGLAWMADRQASLTAVAYYRPGATVSPTDVPLAIKIGGLDAPNAPESYNIQFIEDGGFNNTAIGVQITRSYGPAGFVDSVFFASPVVSGDILSMSLSVTKTSVSVEIGGAQELSYFRAFVDNERTSTTASGYSIGRDSTWLWQNISMSSSALTPGKIADMYKGLARNVTTYVTPAGIHEGDLVTFTADFSGETPIAIQWRTENGTEIPGATGATLVREVLSTDDNAGFFATATNVHGSADSNMAYMLAGSE